MLEGKKILVTGGTGFIGINLIKRLLKEDVEIVATLHNKDSILKDEVIKYIKVDLRNGEDCKKVVKNIDYVFMCAAHTSGAAVIEKTPLVHLTPNILMNVQMLEAAYEAGVKKFLYISSNVVYPLTDYAVKETDMNYEFYEKYFVSAWMKRFTEIVCEMYATKIENPMKTVVVRPANIIGEFDDFEWETSHVIPALIRKVVERHDPIEVWGDGNDLKEFIYIDDFIDGLVLAIEKMESFDPINIAAGHPYTVKEMLQMILEVDNYTTANVEYNSLKPSMIPKRLIDVSKAEKILSFKAKTSMKDALKKTVEWYRSFDKEKQ